MFNFNNKTDFEQLLFAKTYIKELKIEVIRQKKIAETAVNNLNTFIEDVRKLGKRGARLISYKLENQMAHKKNRTLSTKLAKIEHKNYLLRKELRKLKTK